MNQLFDPSSAAQKLLTEPQTFDDAVKFLKHGFFPGFPPTLSHVTSKVWDASRGFLVKKLANAGHELRNLIRYIEPWVDLDLLVLTGCGMWDDVAR